MTRDVNVIFKNKLKFIKEKREYYQVRGGEGIVFHTTLRIVIDLKVNYNDR